MREWTEDMGEISGFGGGYEATCRKMVLAGMQWIDEHPQADPQFYGYEGVYGILEEDNAEAKTLSRVVVEASGNDCTGAMHQACIGHVLAYKRLGWEEYCKQLRERETRET